MNNLQFLSDWKEGVSSFIGKRSAQSYFGVNRLAMATSSACGAGDDKPAPKPSACGAGDDDKPEPKPTACGSACGAGDK